MQLLDIFLLIILIFREEREGEEVEDEGEVDQLHLVQGEVDNFQADKGKDIRIRTYCLAAPALACRPII